MEITKSIKYIGVDDLITDLFEGQYEIPFGISYNSYVIMDEKIAVMDTVAGEFGEEWRDNLKAALGKKKPDYLIIHHMEPDHSANIALFAEEYKKAVIVASQKAFAMMKNFYGEDYADRRLVISEGSELNLGSRTLKFIAAPMVHWPEVMMSCDDKDGVFFSADAFGTFGANGTRDDDDWAPKLMKHDFEARRGLGYGPADIWEHEAKRYYFGIVGKYGAAVQNVLKKIANFDIKKICPLHGPVLSEDLDRYLKFYDDWSSYTPDSDVVTFAYFSAHGNTEIAVFELAGMLERAGIDTFCFDLAREDMYEVLGEAFSSEKLILACPTYNGGLFPAMKSFIEALTDRGYQNRSVGFIENGSWAPASGRLMKAMFEKSKGIKFLEPVVTVNSSLNEDSMASLEALASEILGFA